MPDIELVEDLRVALWKILVDFTAKIIFRFENNLGDILISHYEHNKISRAAYKQAWMLQWKACTCACTFGLGLRLGPDHNTLTWDWGLGLMLFVAYWKLASYVPWKCPKGLCVVVWWWVCKPNLVKYFCPGLLIWTCVLCLCQGKPFNLKFNF